MKKFAIIYNMGETAFCTHKGLTKSLIERLIKHQEYVYMGVIQGNEIEDIFDICNLEHPEFLIEKVRELSEDLESFPGCHTSMSVGDLIYDFDKDCYWQVLRCGWQCITN